MMPMLHPHLQRFVLISLSRYAHEAIVRVEMPPIVPGQSCLRLFRGSRAFGSHIGGLDRIGGGQRVVDEIPTCYV